MLSEPSVISDIYIYSTVDANAILSFSHSLISCSYDRYYIIVVADPMRAFTCKVGAILRCTFNLNMIREPTLDLAFDIFT